MRANVTPRGFTLIELLVVMVIIAMLLSIAVPRYFGSLERTRETALRQTLSVTRESLSRFYGDTGKYPDSLETLVTKRYLQRLPLDPITESTATWTLIAPEDPEKGAVYDLHSGAAGNARDGTPYREW